MSHEPAEKLAVGKTYFTPGLYKVAFHCSKMKDTWTWFHLTHDKNKKKDRG